MEFDDYVRQRGAALVRLGRLLTGDRHQGEDLAQEVLARAFVRWDRIAADPPEPYLRRMLVNAAISRWRLRSFAALRGHGPARSTALSKKCFATAGAKSASSPPATLSNMASAPYWRAISMRAR